MEAQNAIYLDKEMGGKGRQFKSRFLVPGLVKYDYGVCLLTKENADKFIQGFIGCPVVINHQDVTDANAKDVSVGNIFSVWFDEKDGYYWCNGIITDKHAIELIDKGYSVSCQYTITEYSDNVSGALHNGNPYDKIIENGKPEHLAIVNNPRYEGAIIAVNAILAQNEDKWITIKPNGEDAKGRHLLIKEGETVHEAMQRNYGIDGAKGQQKLFDTTGDRKTKEDYKREADEKQAKYDEIDKKHEENLKKEATEKEEKKNKLIQDYIDRKISPEDLEKALPDLSFNEWHDIAEKRMNTPEQKQSDTKEDKEEKRHASEEWENKYRGSKKQRELYNTKTNELAIALLDNNKEKAEYLKGMTSILSHRRDKNYINRQKEIFENIKKQDKDLYNEPLIQGQIEAIKIIEEEQTASNSFVSQFKDTLYTALAEGIANRLGELIASNEDKWITIHPHGEESEDYRRLLIKDGETVEDAMHRQGYYNKRQAKDEKDLKNELKQLYQDILKAKKDGNKELHHKLLERYKKIEEQLKGKKEPNKEDKKKEETTSKPIAGVSKGQPMSRQQADNNNPNPGYMKKAGCTSNCQTCVVAFEARLRGYNVQALGNYNNPTIKSLSHRTNTAWIDPKTGEHPEYKYDASVKNAKTCYQWLEKELQVGNRYTIEFGWKGRRHTGHIVSIEKDKKNNNIIIYDPQNGNITTEKNDVLKYFQRFKYQMSTYGIKIPDPPKVLRIDNLDFNYDVVDKILEKSN